MDVSGSGRDCRGVSGGVPGFFSHTLGVRGLLNLRGLSS
jgi:hypothetical protein